MILLGRWSIVDEGACALGERGSARAAERCCMRCCESAASHLDLSAHGEKQSDGAGEHARAEQPRLLSLNRSRSSSAGECKVG